MSTLLDSLRQARQVDTAVPLSSGRGRQVEAILSTLGYARSPRPVRVLRLAVVGVALVSVVLMGWVMWERWGAMLLGTQVAMSEGAAEPVVPPAPGGDAVPVVSRGPLGDTVPRPLPDVPNPVATPDQTPSNAVFEAPPPEDAVETPPPEDEDETGDRGSPASGVQPRTVEPRLGAEPSHAVGTASDVAGAGGPDDAVTEPLPGLRDFAPPVPTIERRPAVSEVFAAALALQRAGDVAGAVDAYQTLLAEGTRSAQVHNNLGLLYQEQNRLDDAVREFQRAIVIDPRHSKAHNNLGVVRMRQARHQDAAAAFRDARRIDSTNLDAWGNLALALQAAGDPVAARRTLIDALSVDTRHAPTHYNLARLFEIGGDMSRAVEHYGRFVEHSNTEHAELVETVRRRIAALSATALQ